MQHASRERGGDVGALACLFKAQACFRVEYSALPPLPKVRPPWAGLSINRDGQKQPRVILSDTAPAGP